MPNTPDNLTNAAKKRRQELIDDPCIDGVEPYAVTCKGCGGRIKLSPKGLYDGSHWRKHKARCTKLGDLLDGASTDKNAKKDASKSSEKAKSNSEWVAPAGVLTEADLRELNVAQLKAICKEKNLTGYSKLTRPFMIRRILDHYASVTKTSQPIAGTSTSARQSSKLPTPPTSQSPHYNPPRQDTIAERMIIAVDNLEARPEAVSQLNQRVDRVHTATRSMLPPDPIVVGNSTTQGIKRPSHSADESAGQEPLVKKLKAKDGTAVLSPSKPSSRSTQEIRTKIPLTSSFARNNAPTPSVQPTSRKYLPQPSGFISASSHHDTSSVRGTPGSALPKQANPKQKVTSPPSTVLAKKSETNAKRFTPLVTKKPVPLPLIPSAAKPINKSTPEASSGSVPTASNLANMNHSVPAFYLDFAGPPILSFDRLTIPPPLSKNRYILPYSIILSQVSKADIKQCMLVSRTIRRAVYVSAGTRLLRDFSGQRLESVMAEYSPNIFNLWPYLQHRQAEVAQRRQAYECSFLAKIFRRENPHIVSQQLWTSPDNERQVVIALRFLLTRLFFSVSIGDQNGFSWLEGTVIDAQEVVKDEIWRVVVQYPNSSSTGTFSSCGGSGCVSQESFYVLESTCEVVGHTPLPASSSETSSMSMSSSGPLRADWSAYIARKTSMNSMQSSQLRQSSEAQGGLGLISQLSWTNHEEYDKGMSRHWLKKISEEGETGKHKRMMAERYILACVVENSISGQWKSSTEMAQDFAGMGGMGYVGSGGSVNLKRSSKIHLFLPEHHLIESVHFTSRSGVPLHPALAIVQTPKREYFVLKDNGMQVGCEEEGVAEVWMDLIGCDRFGLVSKTNEGGRFRMGVV